jgi:hypothetical protein
LNRKTTSAMETLLLNDVFLCTQLTTWSKYVEIAMDKPRRRGRITLLKTKKPAYTAMNGFHWSGARGLKPVYRTKNSVSTGETLFALDLQFISIITRFSADHINRKSVKIDQHIALVLPRPYLFWESKPCQWNANRVTDVWDPSIW